ncbi:MAG: tripartite tricarboxylate transporter TctB family protein [Burkholderiales bacterium]
MIIDRIISAAALFLAAVYLYATTRIPTLEIGDPLGPKAFPNLLGIALILAAILLFIETLKAGKSDQPVAPAAPRENMRHLWMIGGVVMWTAIYFGVFDLAGYLLTTTIYLLVLTSVFNRGKWRANVLTSVLFALGSYVLFVKILGVTLPKGMQPFESLSSAVDVVWTFAASAISSIFRRG